MPKVGINVGEDFPAEDAPESPDAPREGSDHACPDREEWHRRHAEWHAKARAFKEDVRRAARRHFGGESFLAHNMFVMRALLAILAAVLLIALLPKMLILGVILTAIAFILFQRHRFHRHEYDGGEV